MFAFILSYINKRRGKRLKYLGSPLPLDITLSGHKGISIGKNVYIGRGGWLAASNMTGDKDSTLIIKDGCSIGRFSHIYATGSIVIENKALLAEHVYIADNVHSYKDITIPIKDQGVNQNNHVIIGEGCWIGENVCIIGASIGKNSVIGANSVVTRDVPDYCVAVGIPARIIKRYDNKKGEWINV